MEMRGNLRAPRRAPALGGLGRILILGLNYAPEEIGIGPYTAEMSTSLAQSGYSVEVITAKAYYPQWRVREGQRGWWYKRSVEDGILVTRCPLYVPRNPTGARRILHYASFSLSAAMPVLRSILRRKPDVVLVVAPSLMSSILGRAAAHLAGAISWLHIQDFEVGAAFATGLIDRESSLGRLAATFERKSMQGFDRYSSISPQMCARISALQIPQERIAELRNWADIDSIRPMDRPSSYRKLWNIVTPHVALYSGNIANKQDIEIITDAARLLKSRTDITFVVCGEGPQWKRLVAAGSDLPNIQFHSLQPRSRLNELVNLATIHLLPQLGGAADLVLPSKLTNMLASGRPVVGTAHADTGLANEILDCGIVVRPGDRAAFARAIAQLADDPALHQKFGTQARARAEERWSKGVILDRLRTDLGKLLTSSRPRRCPSVDHSSNSGKPVSRPNRSRSFYLSPRRLRR